MIEKLKNCPNCAGVLDEVGRCSYCGSKVYDFLTINFDSTYYDKAKTYIRVRSGEEIYLLPVRFVKGAEIRIEPSVCRMTTVSGEEYVVRSTNDIDVSLEFSCGEGFRFDVEGD